MEGLKGLNGILYPLPWMSIGCQHDYVRVAGTRLSRYLAVDSRGRPVRKSLRKP